MKDGHDMHVFVILEMRWKEICRANEVQLGRRKRLSRRRVAEGINVQEGSFSAVANEVPEKV